MRIRMGGIGPREFQVILPLGLLATRLGAAIVCGVVNRRRTGGAPSLEGQVQDGEITPRQMRQLGRALRQGAAALRASGLPLLETQSQDGEWVRIEL